MFPVLFELGPITVYSYGVLLAASYLLALYYAVRRARQFGLDASRVLDFGIYIIISALVGAKLLLLIVDFDVFWRQPAELWTLSRQIPLFMLGSVPTFAVCRLVQARWGLGAGLAAGWLVFLSVLIPLTVRQWRREGRADASG